MKNLLVSLPQVKIDEETLTNIQELANNLHWTSIVGTALLRDKVISSASLLRVGSLVFFNLSVGSGYSTTTRYYGLSSNSSYADRPRVQKSIMIKYAHLLTIVGFLAPSSLINRTSSFA